jgi:hypothetical protein
MHREPGLRQRIARRARRLRGANDADMFAAGQCSQMRPTHSAGAHQA